MDAGADVPEDAGPAPITVADKLDVLFVVDNSPTGDEVHPALSATVPYFLDRLVNPRCVNGLGQIVDDPPSLDAPCERGVRDFAPLADVHLAVVSTSLGGHGADTCSPASANHHPDQDDKGRLLTRNAAGGVVPSYEGLGFLAWDPDRANVPPGDDDLPTLQAKLREIVEGVGGRGCGFESQLETFYRFLIDPNPYSEIVVESGSARLVGTDTVLLEQRAAFLRPDSAVLVVLVSDEDDCSTRDGGQYFYANQSLDGDTPYHLPRARDECAADPDDACCASCGQVPPPGCPPSASCTLPPYSDVEDPVTLRCFDQKRRFGLDFLQPISRYHDALTASDVADRDGQIAANPLFVGNRSPQLVVLTAFAGVPWPDIAIAATNVGAGYLPNVEIPYERILRDQDTGAAPEDPLMWASREPRSGASPVTGDALAPTSAPLPDANPINGHEHAMPDELQYACIYPLSAPEACAQDECECTGADAAGSNPICQDPQTGAYGDVQFFGRAAPATRQLSLLQRLGPQGVLASICTAPETDPTSDSFAYKPAVDAVARALHRRLVPY